MKITTKSTDRKAVTQELRVIFGWPIMECMKTADNMIKGGAIDGAVGYGVRSDILDIERPPDFDSPEYYRRYHTLKRTAWDEIKRGANGDVEVAIAVCKKLENGELSWLFAAYA
jgi:hypothetical protein